MALLPDWEIAQRCAENIPLSNRMILPFSSEQVKLIRKVDKDIPIVSFGLSSYGYDIRIDKDFKIFHNAFSGLVDPKNFTEESFVSYDAQEKGYVIIPPNSFVLGMSLEVINVPRDILVLCIGKSTYARCGLIVNVTPLEPEWRGRITIEISNTTPLPAKVYAYEGIAQLLFFVSDLSCNVSYADKKGKYQDQDQVTLPRM